MEYIITLIITVIISVILKEISGSMKNKNLADILSKIAEIAVNAVEEKTRNTEIKGAAKKIIAESIVQDALNTMGIRADSDMIDAVIHGKVNEMRK